MYILDKEISKKDKIKLVVIKSNDLKGRIQKYLLSNVDKQYWICNPFVITMKEIKYLKAQEEFAVLLCYFSLRIVVS